MANKQIIGLDTKALEAETFIATQKSGDADFKKIDIDLLMSSKAGLVDGKVPAQEVSIEKIGTPTYDDLKDWFDTTQSAGILSGGEITDVGDGTINTSLLSGIIKTTDSAIGINKMFNLGSNRYSIN